MAFSSGVAVEQFLKDLKESEKPVLIDFWATWCPPCKALMPHVDALKDKLADRVKVIKVDIEENPAIASHFKVQSIPTLKVFVGGIEVKTRIGGMSAEDLEKFVLGAIGQ